MLVPALHQNHQSALEYQLHHQRHNVSSVLDFLWYLQCSQLYHHNYLWTRLLLCVPAFTLSVFCHTQVHVSDTHVHIGGKECISSNESVVDLDDCLNLYIRGKPLTWCDLINFIWHHISKCATSGSVRAVESVLIVYKSLTCGGCLRSLLYTSRGLLWQGMYVQ